MKTQEVYSDTGDVLRDYGRGSALSCVLNQSMRTMQVNPQNIEATLAQMEQSMILATAKLIAITDVFDALAQHKPVEELLTALAGYAESLKIGAEIEVASLRHNIEELTAIRQHMESGLVLPGTPSNLVASGR